MIKGKSVGGWHDRPRRRRVTPQRPDGSDFFSGMVWWDNQP
ncbi:hypothetical protein [Phormidium sp. CCY1219]|nr:hypothetical protein [Phormidium sp. CCY1219]